MTKYPAGSFPRNHAMGSLVLGDASRCLGMLLRALSSCGVEVGRCPQFSLLYNEHLS